MLLSRRLQLAFASIVAVGCTERARAVQPEPHEKTSASASSVASAPAAMVSTTPSASSQPVPPDPPTPMTPDIAARAERWRQRIFKRVLAPIAEQGGFSPETIALEHHRRGAFGVVVATVPAPVIAGGGEGTHEMFIVTKSGQLELQDAPDVVGIVDLNGDGRPDLLLKDVTAIADMPNGPLVLKVGAKGGAYGWRDARIGTHEGAAAIVATTETNTSREVGILRAGGYMARESKGVLEEVILVWNGKQLAEVARKPLETAAEAAARQKQFVDEARKEEEQRAGVRAACANACPADCARTDGGAACVKACTARCKE